MKLLSLSLCVLLPATLTHALKFPVKQVKTRSDLRKRSTHLTSAHTLAAASSSDEVDLNTVHDLIYLANLDTGSSDLWVKGSSSPLPHSTQSTIAPINLTYGIGWAYGTISYAAVEFAGFSISSQAYLDVSKAENPALSYGADGIAGLGFTSLSTIDAWVNHTGGSTGRSLLYNAFAANPSEPNYIAFSLQRSTDPDSDVEGSFSIGEVESQYSAVLNSTALSTWPEAAPSRWNVLLDAVLVGSKTISVSSVVDGAPSGKAVVLLDSGTSYTYASEDVCNAIYGNVDGAQYDSSLGQWVVPCDAEVDVALQFGGNVYPIHPLDMTPASVSDPNTCLGSFIPQAVAVGGGEFDWLIGDNVLRSIYSIYDFGDFDSSGSMGNPYVKLLSLVDPDKASTEFHEIRGGSAASNITYNAANSTSSSSSSSSSSSAGSSGAVQLSADTVDTINQLARFLPAVLALVALNAFVLLVLAAAGLVYVLRRRSSRARPRKNPGRMSPMPMNTQSAYMDSVSAPSHTYEPVSMALTDDTFVPPSPAFQKDGSKLRPMSVA
ncbi:hypothetical protein EIP86_005673 [Pleurotus ostreatoroseus]|nr:hypothetical protein EIP86_005673 [Pleurotus ostreatoroseus]